MKKLMQLEIQKIPHLSSHLQPFFLHTASNKKLIVLLHGLSAYPWEMSFLGRYLSKQKFSVYAPIISDFYQFQSFYNFSYQYWLNNIKIVFDKLAQYTDSVIVIGHSLGGLLSVYSALKFPIVKEIVLVNAVIKLNNPFINFLPLLFPFWKGLNIKTKPEFQNNYFPYFPAQAIYQLSKLASIIRKSADTLEKPTFIIASKADKTISLKAIQQFYGSIKSEKKIKIYQQAPHSILTPIYKNRYQVYKEILDFIKNTT